MKKLMVFAVIAAMFCSCTSSDRYTIVGNVTGLDGNVVLLDEYGASIDEATVKSGKFKFKGEVIEPMIVYLSDDMEPFAMFFLEEGKITVSGDVNLYGGINVGGTVANERYDDYSKSVNVMVESFYAAESDEEKEEIMEADEAFRIASIDENLDNVFGLYMLSQMNYSWSSDKVLKKLNEFTPDLQRTAMGINIRDNAEAKKRTEEGQPYINIALPDPNGNEVALSSYVGKSKYILIDFWASWCRPCMQEVPHLKEAYNKYHKRGFEIYAVSLDRNQSDWVRAIEGEKMNWVHVYQMGDPESTAANDYSVYSIPSNFLIDSDGTIIAKNLRGVELNDMLVELLGK